jgi:vacuolar-type H+-ATPase subunit E/Vma4
MGHVRRCAGRPGHRHHRLLDDAICPLAKAEIISSEAKEDAKEANDKATILSASFSLYREQIAREYIHREVMREVEDRLTQAIERLGDRLDRVLERAEK